ncbi:MAG: hypothetical protein EBV83_10215 [Verrucomicrobia bacterium]|nr:hypothetical protein [Verrucomicrobiota bacterium]
MTLGCFSREDHIASTRRTHRDSAGKLFAKTPVGRGFGVAETSNRSRPGKLWVTGRFLLGVTGPDQ